MKNLNTNALENLKLDLENHVLIVTMNRPKALNALNNQTLDELQMVFDYVSKEMTSTALSSQAKAEALLQAQTSCRCSPTEVNRAETMPAMHRQPSTKSKH